MPVPLMEGCQNPRGCRKVATSTVEAVHRGTGEKETVELCAYCVDEVEGKPEVDVTVVDR
jgi:hypothetical protein